MIVFVVGPTAVRKSAAACRLAQRIEGEIVSCDAMQVYRGVAIASNKPSAQMLRTVPHHLIDIVTLGREFDVAAFNRKARAAIRGILSRSKVPVVSGGSGMYMQILLDGIFEPGARDGAVRARLRETVAAKGLKALYQKLCRVDPESAKKIHPHDERRIIRALEVVETTGAPLSEKKLKRSGLWGKHDIQLFALYRDRSELYAMIDRRVEEMFAAGLVKEVQAVRKKRLSSTAARIIGLPEVGGYLNGEYTLARAKELMKMHTRRYAKRQLTWLRKEKRLQWILVGPQDTPDSIARKVQSALPGAVEEWKKK